MTGVSKKLNLKVVEQVRPATAAAKEDVLHSKTVEILLKTRPEELISADSEAEVIKGNANPPGCWLHSPAMVELFASADKRLTRVANWSGMPVKRVAKVHARLIPGTKLLIITAAKGEDLTATPVHRYGSAATFNVVTLLSGAGLTVQTGYRELYDIAYVPRESPLWPALVVDLSQVKERRAEPNAKRETAGQPPDPEEPVV